MAWWNRVRRRPEPSGNVESEVLAMLAARSIKAQAAADVNQLRKSIPLPPGTATLAGFTLEAPFQTLLVTKIGGDAAGHAGRMELIGTHLLVDRAALAAAWPSGWATAVRDVPLEPPGGLGPPRDYTWRATDASDRAAVAAAELLKQDDRITYRVLPLLRQGTVMQYELVPTPTALRIAAHQQGRQQPAPAALEAVLTIGRTLIGEADG